MKKKKIIIRILVVLLLLTVMATTIAYFMLEGEKPWLAFYIACSGGVLAFNFLISLFFLFKNSKD